MSRIATVSLLMVVLLAGCSTTATTPTPTPTPEVVDREITTGTISLEGLPVSQSFRFQNGEVHAEFPIRVEFQRPDAGNWTPVQVFNVDEMEWFTVELTGGTHYRIVIEDVDGERRAMGLYTPVKKDAERTVLIGGCCVDDFGSKKTNTGEDT